MRVTLPLRIVSQRRRCQGPVSVGFVIDRLSRAGTETQLLALIRGLDRSRVRPCLVILNGDDPESIALEPAECTILRLHQRSLMRFSTLRTALKMVRFWKRNRVEVLQTYFLDSTYLAAPLARLAGIRRVYRVRNNAGYWLTKSHRMLGKLVGRSVDLTLTNSDDGRRALMEAEGMPENRVRVVENGVDLERFEGLPPPDFRRTPLRIGIVANLRPVKNLDGLIRAVAMVPQVRLDIAGDGPMRDELQRQIDQSNVSDRVHLRGAIADVPRFLGECDLAVLSSHSESMSNAVLEYMAAGRGIVATDVGANAKLIRHGVDGLIVPPNDDAAMVTAIREMMANPEMGDGMARSAKVRAETAFSRAAMIGKFHRLFESVRE